MNLSFLILQTSAEDGYAIWCLLVALVSILESIGSIVLIRTLVNVQHPDVHGDCHCTLELNPLSEGIPTKKGWSISYLPHLDQTITVKVRSGPKSLINVGSTVVFWEVFIPPQVDVVSLLYAEGKTTKYYIPKSIFSLIFKTFNYINFNFKRQGERFKDDNVFQTKNRKNKARGIGADKKPVSKQSKQIIAQSLPNSCLYTNITELQSWAHATIVA